MEPVKLEQVTSYVQDGARAIVFIVFDWRLAAIGRSLLDLAKERMSTVRATEESKSSFVKIKIIITQLNIKARKGGFYLFLHSNNGEEDEVMKSTNWNIERPEGPIARQL